MPVNQVYVLMHAISHYAEVRRSVPTASCILRIKGNADVKLFEYNLEQGGYTSYMNKNLLVDSETKLRQG